MHRWIPAKELNNVHIIHNNLSLLKKHRRLDAMYCWPGCQGAITSTTTSRNSFPRQLSWSFRPRFVIGVLSHEMTTTLLRHRLRLCLSLLTFGQQSCFLLASWFVRVRSSSRVSAGLCWLRPPFGTFVDHSGCLGFVDWRQPRLSWQGSRRDRRSIWNWDTVYNVISSGTPWNVLWRVFYVPCKKINKYL